MRGVPPDLDLSNFMGDTLVQVCLGEREIQFRFQNGGIISVEGRWELRDASGRELDKATEQTERDCYRVHVLLGAKVVGSNVDAPRSFSLIFDNGMKLTVFDDSEQYESFSIQPGNTFV